MFFHFRTTMGGKFPTQGDKPAPVTSDEQQTLIDLLQDYKTNEFKRLVEEEAEPRPGVLRLMDEAFADPTVRVGVCSAATKEAALKTLQTTLGEERLAKLDVLLLGDDVSAKKPDPLIYNTARERLDMKPEQCIVIEDSIVGLRAAVAAKMKCIITYTPSTADRDFYGEGAAATIPDLESRQVTLTSILQPLRDNGYDAELLVGMKDPVTVTNVVK
jgi:HAD superfamily hydrolase (TIGR01509 family)